MAFLAPRKAYPGDKVAVLSPSFAAPAVAPEVHEQGLERLEQVTGLKSVEYPTTRNLGASPLQRAQDINAAFGDPAIRAIHSSIGGEDQITLIRYLDAEQIMNDPKPFLGYSDNTNMLNWLWNHGVTGFYGGSTQVQLGPGPQVDPIHESSLRAALLTGERLELTEPGESEDFGHDWQDPRALTEFGGREPTEPWVWSGPSRAVTGRTWGGCIEVVQWMFTAGRFPTEASVLDGGVLLLESSEELITTREFAWILRSLGERGLIGAVDAVIVARPPASNHTVRPTAHQRKAHREEQREVTLDHVSSYNPEAVTVVGPPFGHTRPQWIVPYGGYVTVDGQNQRIFADYS